MKMMVENKPIATGRTYCNPLSIPDCPRGSDGMGAMACTRKAMEFTQEEPQDYRSISDPSVLYHDGKWYLYPSYGMTFVSEDFVTWKHVRSTPYAPGYSPCVIPHRGKFYMTAHSNALFVGDSPTGPFAELGDFIRPDGSSFRPTDPALFVDDDGRVYMYWHGRAMADGVSVTGTLGAELDADDLRKLITVPKILNTFDPSHAWERFGEDNQNEKFGWVEGQWMVKHNGRYYLIYASNGTQFGAYAMGAYYSDAGPLDGFVYQQRNPITRRKYGLVSGAGHGCIVHGPNNTLWAFYTSRMCYAHPYERRIGMDPVGVDENGELYCPGVSETPQFGPGVLAQPEKGNATGLLPLTLCLRARHFATSYVEGRNPLYALDESLLTWWQPRREDPEKQLTVKLGAEYTVEASRIIWREIGLDYDNGVVPGPFRYKIEACLDIDDPVWVVLLDRTWSTEDYNTDYRSFPPVVASAVRLAITGSPGNIDPGVVSFVVFGKRA